MMALALSMVSVAAFVTLAMSMDRHARDVLGRAPVPARRLVLRVAGWVLLGVALVLGMLGWGTSVGVVEWVAALTVATVPLTLLVLPRFAARRGPAARRVAPSLDAADGPMVRGVSGRLWRGVCWAGLVAMPLFMVWAFTQVPPAPVQRSDALAGQVGPWSFVIAEIEQKPPVASALGTAMKGFQVRFCEACDAQIREAYLKIRKPRSLRGAGMVFAGPPWKRQVEIQIAPTARVDDGLWLTVEGMDGSVHHVEVDIARLSPATARFMQTGAEQRGDAP